VLREGLAGAIFHRGDGVVVVGGVVVKEHEGAHPGFAGDAGGVEHGAVSPADVAAEAVAAVVLLGGVLRVVDEHVGAVGELHEGPIGVGVGLGVGGVHEAVPGVLNAPGKHAPRVVALDAVHRHAPVEVDGLAHGHVARPQGTRDPREIDGKIRRAHLALEGLTERRAAHPTGVAPQDALGVKQRREEGQALDVIPVQVGEKQMGVEGVALAERGRAARLELLAEVAQARAAVKHDAMAPHLHLDAARIAAHARRARPRCSDATPHAPERDDEVSDPCSVRHRQDRPAEGCSPPPWTASTNRSDGETRRGVATRRSEAQPCAAARVDFTRRTKRDMLSPICGVGRSPSARPRRLDAVAR
jgi:hypothetical protein